MHTNISPHISDARRTTYVLRPTTYILRPTTYVLRPTTYDLHPTTYVLRPTTYVLRPTTYILRPTSYVQKGFLCDLKEGLPTSEVARACVSGQGVMQQGVQGRLQEEELNRQPPDREILTERGPWGCAFTIA